MFVPPEPDLEEDVLGFLPVVDDDAFFVILVVMLFDFLVAFLATAPRDLVALAIFWTTIVGRIMVELLCVSEQLATCA